jgi:hypothetical protein
MKRSSTIPTARVQDGELFWRPLVGRERRNVAVVLLGLGVVEAGDAQHDRSRLGFEAGVQIEAIVALRKLQVGIIQADAVADGRDRRMNAVTNRDNGRVGVVLQAREQWASPFLISAK